MSRSRHPSPPIDFQRTGTRPPLLRLAFVAVGLLACLLGTWSAGRIGRARALSARSLRTGALAPAAEAVRLSPADPEAHRARAVALMKHGELAEAIKEYERAAALRPRAYELWIELGRARDDSGDSEGAFAAFAEAARRAPFYAKPRWEMGVLLLKTGRRDEAFVAFRRAATSYPAMFTKVIELAWAAYGDEAETIRQVLQPQTTQERLALAHSFIRHGRAAAALSLLRAAVDLPVDERRQLLTELLAAGQFPEAYELWLRTATGRAPGGGDVAISDAGFESGDISDEVGFSWRLAESLRAVSATPDKSEPHSGVYSLRLDWRGAAHTSDQIISQLVLVEPGVRYRLSFAARTKEVVTGSAPIITVTDVSRADEQKLGQSTPLPQGSGGWQEYKLEFTTPKPTRAVRIAVQRESCPLEPCPIFGSIWLDDFSLQQLSRIPVNTAEYPAYANGTDLGENMIG